MPANDWLEIELWRIRQAKLNKMVYVEVVKPSQPRFITRLIMKVGKMLVIVGHYLQTVEQPSYHQTINNPIR